MPSHFVREQKAFGCFYYLSLVAVGAVFYSEMSESKNNVRVIVGRVGA